MFTPLLRRLLEPIEKPLDFRLRYSHLAVFHPDCPKRSVADQAAERYKGNAKALGGLAESEDFFSRIGRIGRCQSAPLSAPGCSSGPWSCTAAGFAIAGYPLCWALSYGNASRSFSCCGMVLLLAD